MKLINLRYLNFEGTKVNTFPKAITKLENLDCIRHSDVKKLLELDFIKAKYQLEDSITLRVKS